MTDLNTDAIANDFDPNEFLEQYGTKGMKWGVRRKSEPVKPSTDRKQVNQHIGKPVHALTNRQLKLANNRLDLEKKYKDLTRQPSAIDKIKKGNATATTILATVGIGVSVYNLYKSQAGQAAIAKGAQILQQIKS